MKLPLSAEPIGTTYLTLWNVLDADGTRVCQVAAESDARAIVRALVRAVNAAAGLAEALERCDVSMDTAATLGLAQQLPQAYRDSWAAAHTAARHVLDAYCREAP